MQKAIHAAVFLHHAHKEVRMKQIPLEEAAPVWLAKAEKLQGTASSGLYSCSETVSLVLGRHRPVSDRIQMKGFRCQHTFTSPAQIDDLNSFYELNAWDQQEL